MDMAAQHRPTGEAIRTLRIIAGLTLDQAAVIADTAPAYLSKVETGKLTPTVGYVANVTASFAEHIKSRADLSNKVPA